MQAARALLPRDMPHVDEREGERGETGKAVDEIHWGGTRGGSFSAPRSIGDSPHARQLHRHAHSL
jgi:hypothetical protein